MSYIEGFVIAVPNGNKAAFIEHAETMDALFLEVGAIRVVECWEDEVSDGEVTDFRRAVNATADESVVFSWIEWPDKEARNRGYTDWEERGKTDERFEMSTMPFDGKRMIFGGFIPVVEHR
jgi:uncharacterized protein YbaA (DUF1428 family)